jgi:hypothetical protein
MVESKEQKHEGQNVQQAQVNKKGRESEKQTLKK